MKTTVAEKTTQPRSSGERRGPQTRPGAAAGGALLALQRAAGNQAVDGLLGGDAGQPLDSGLSDEMSARFGQDFRGVRVHTYGQAAAQARDMGARAFTTGEHIVFGEGAYAPATPAGKRLLAHELAHVIQQRAAAGKTLRGVSQPGDAYERAAGIAAQQVLAGPPASAEAGLFAPGGGVLAGGAPPAVQRQEVEAPAAERSAAEVNQQLDEFTAAIIETFVGSPENMDTRWIIDSSLRRQGDIAEPVGPKTYYTSLRFLVKAHQVLSERVANAPRNDENVLLYKNPWTDDLQPWAGSAKSLDDIYPFTPENVAFWKSVLHEENLGNELIQPPVAQVGSGQAAPAGGGAGAVQTPPSPPPPPTMIGSVLKEGQALPTEEQDPQAMKSDVTKGIGVLNGTTVQQAVQGIRDTLANARKSRKDPQEVIAYHNDENADLSLLKASGRVIYVGTYVYILDRTGHILSTEFNFEGISDLAAGGVYFFGNFALGTKGSPYATTQRIMLRLDQGTPAPSGGNVYVGSILNAWAPLITGHIEPTLQNNSGIAIIVSSSIDQRVEKSQEINTDNILQAVLGAEYYLPWAVRSYGRNALQNWDQVLFQTAINLGIGRLSKFIPVIGQAKMMYDLLLEEKWFLDMINVAGRAVSADEINLVSQALAWKVAEWAVGKAGGILKKGLKKTAGALGGTGKAKAGGTAGPGAGESNKGTPTPQRAPAPAEGGSTPAGKTVPKAGEGVQVIPFPGKSTQAGGSDAAKGMPAPKAAASEGGSGAPPPAPTGGGAGEGGKVLPFPNRGAASPAAGGGPSAVQPGGAGGKVVPFPGRGAPPATEGGSETGSAARPGAGGEGGKVLPFPNRGAPPSGAGDNGAGKTAPGAGEVSKPVQPAGEGAKVIPLRPKSKSDKPLSEPASQEIPQNVVRDATTGQPVQVVPLPGAGNKAPEGGAIPPTASATNGSGGAGGGKPPAGVPPVQGSSPVQAGHASAPAAGGNKAGGKKGGGTGSQGSDSPASKQQQGGDLVDLEAERAKRSLQKGQPANDNAETQAAPKSAAGPAIETEVQKARRDTLQSTNPVERANPPAKGTPNRNLPDVRSRFTTTEDPTPEGGQVVTTAGELGEPGKVQSFRSRYQQSKVSKHTGDDAGHRIGSDFGGPQDATNLARQNWIQNQGEGTFYDLETRWKDSLHNGARVYATVSDHFRPGENRPYKRTAEWTEVKSDGTVVHGQEVFGNFSSEKSRGAEDKYGPK